MSRSFRPMSEKVKVKFHKIFYLFFFKMNRIEQENEYFICACAVMIEDVPQHVTLSDLLKFALFVVDHPSVCWDLIVEARKLLVVFLEYLATEHGQKLQSLREACGQSHIAVESIAQIETVKYLMENSADSKKNNALFLHWCETRRIVAGMMMARLDVSKVKAFIDARQKNMPLSAYGSIVEAIGKHMPSIHSPAMYDSLIDMLTAGKAHLVDSQQSVLHEPNKT